MAKFSASLANRAFGYAQCNYISRHGTRVVHDQAAIPLASELPEVRITGTLTTSPHEKQFSCKQRGLDAMRPYLAQSFKYNGSEPKSGRLEIHKLRPQRKFWS